MSKFKWNAPVPGSQYELIPVADPYTYNPPDIEYGTVLLADCFSRNGYYGACWIIKLREGGYVLDAGSNDTGRTWKTPDTEYATIGEAVIKAEELWRPV